MAAGHRHSPAPSVQRHEEISVSTIAVPTDWLADLPASSGTPQRLALTDAALNRLVSALAGQRDSELREDLSPSGIAVLLDAAWCCRQVCLVIVRRNCVGMVRQHLVGRATDAAAPTGVGAVVAVMVVSRG